MPSTIVKLSSSDARAWAHNQPVWLDEGGDIARPVTRQEQHAISRAVARTGNIDQSFRLTLQLLDITANRRNTQPTQNAQKLDCAFEVSHVGQKRIVTVYAGKLRYALGREVLAARLLADHGESVLHGRNGKCIAVLRDPLINERPPVTGRRVQWSRNPADAAEAEAKQLNRRVAPVRQRVTKGRPMGARPTLYSPKNCPNDCRGLRGGGEWALAKAARPPTADEHHPVCKHANAWAETLEGVATNAVLYDLELGRVARAAMPNEVEEAEVVRVRTGISQITVAGRLFAVLPTDEARIASAEAHGQTVTPPDLPDPVEGEFDLPDPHGSTEREYDELTDELELTDEHARELLDDTSVLPVVVAPVLIEPGHSSTGDRDEWPSLADITTSDTYRQRAEVTARDYLARHPRPAGRSA